MDLLSLINKFEETEDVFIPDLTDVSHNAKIQEFTDLLYKNASSSKDLIDLETKLVKTKKVFSLFSHTAVKNAKSKKFLSEIKENIHVTIVFAVYNEHLRILSKDEHEFGEDFLMIKINQLESMIEDFKNISWNMIIVDDGCPNNSGKIAEEILSERYQGKDIEVLYLQDAIDNKLEVVENLKTVDDSNKGGSILYGMWHAVQKDYKNHIVLYTDADLSTHMGQCGLLINSIIKNKKYAAIGSRREVESIVVKSNSRDLRGKLFIYLWKRMLRRLNYIVDSQCGFKAYRADIVKQIVLDNIEKKFAFDLELILKTDLLERLSVEKIAISWIDSDEASTTTELGPYLSMLKSISRMYHKYLPANAEAHKFAFFIRSLNEDGWNTLVNNVPEGIQIKSAIHYDIYDEIKADDFAEILENNSN